MSERKNRIYYPIQQIGIKRIEPTEKWTTIRMKEALEGRRFLVTGAGFLGHHVCQSLKQWGVESCFGAGKLDGDLTDYEDTFDLVSDVEPDYVIHCAGFNGGIEFNRQFPAEILYNNTLMAMNINKVCQQMGVKKLISVITSCAYPDKGWEVLPEDKLWEGEPNESIRAHGIAKRTLQTAAYAYHKQYAFNSVCACITNLYGPGDTFDPVRTKVVGALIRKFVEAKQQGLAEVECWGTGAPLRQFMFVKDAADCLVKALVHYNDHSKPLNIGNSEEITIKELVDLIVHFTGYEGEVKWLVEKGDGQMRKMLETETMNKLFYWTETPFAYGLEETIAWYIENKEIADARK